MVGVVAELADDGDTVVGVVAELADEPRLSGCTHFALRDADSSRPGLFHRFGLTTDDHTREPAFGTYKGPIDRHGRGDAHQCVALLLHSQRQCNTLP
ncbi:hypothetical protein SUDANB148_00932 [Streptomyces sp. SudanB148_2056]